MERWEGHYMDVNHKLQFHLFLKTPWIATQSTIPHVPNRGGYGLSTDNLQPQIPELRALYGTSGPLLRELQPHLSFPTVFINIYIYYWDNIY